MRNYNYYVENEGLFFGKDSTLFNDLALENIQIKGQQLKFE